MQPFIYMENSSINSSLLSTPREVSPPADTIKMSFYDTKEKLRFQFQKYASYCGVLFFKKLRLKSQTIYTAQNLQSD